MTDEMNRLLEERSATGRAGRPLALFVSCAVHLGLAAWFLLPAMGNARAGEMSPAPGFVRVRMVSGPPAGAPSAEAPAVEAAPEPSAKETPPPEPARDPAPRVVEKVPEKTTTPPKMEKPKTKPAAPATQDRGRAAPTPGRTAASGSVGLGSGPGQGGLVGMDGLDTRFSWYLDLVVSRISAVWEEPYLDSRFGKTYKVTVYFVIHRNGSLSDVRVEEPSGVDVLDLSAVRSIREAAPLPPLPQDFRGDHLGVHFWFEYERD